MTTNETVACAANPTLADLATYLQQMRDQERSDLAREIHDELGALLTGAKLEIASLKLRLDGTSNDVVERLTHLAATINSLIAFSRRVVEGLHPSSLTNLGVRASLEILVNEFRKSTDILATADLDQVDLDHETQLTAYRVVQEALNNTSKHAKATEVQVVLKSRGAHVLLSVRDNGTGFDTAAMGLASHGLAGMRHRVSAGGGQLIVRSAPGRGALLIAMLPSRGSNDRRAAPSTPAREYGEIDHATVQAGPMTTCPGATAEAVAQPSATQAVSSAAGFGIPLPLVGTIGCAGTAAPAGLPLPARAAYLSANVGGRAALHRAPQRSRTFDAAG